MFASAGGKRGGQFYRPRSIVKTLVAVPAPHHGKLYHPCCGSGDRFVQSEELIEAHGGEIGDAAIFGQKANPTTWRLAAMNLALRGIDFNLGREPAETFTRDPFLDLRADFILANPPFNISDWWHASLSSDARGVYGDPPPRNANYAWLQHMLQQLKPGGRAGDFVSRSSTCAVQSGLHDLRGESSCTLSPRMPACGCDQHLRCHWLCEPDAHEDFFADSFRQIIRQPSCAAICRHPHIGL